MSIDIKNISFTYTKNTPYEKKALQNVSLKVKDGEFLAICGHMGSGKSTLMQMFNGLIKPDSGTVFVDGIDINNHDDKDLLISKRREIGIVFQYPEQQLFEETIYKDIAFGPQNYNLKADEIDKRVRESMEFVDLDFDEFQGKSPFNISGGQMRRVAIAGILALQPKYLILDEPVAGLDPRLKQILLSKIKKLNEAGMTIIMVSHNMDDIAQFATRVIVLNGGNIVLEGKPAEIFRHAEIIEGAGLLLPEITQLLVQLKDSGLDVDTSIISRDEAISNILKIFRR